MLRYVSSFFSSARATIFQHDALTRSHFPPPFVPSSSIQRHARILAPPHSYQHLIPDASHASIHEYVCNTLSRSYSRPDIPHAHVPNASLERTVSPYDAPHTSTPFPKADLHLPASIALHRPVAQRLPMQNQRNRTGSTALTAHSTASPSPTSPCSGAASVCKYTRVGGVFFFAVKSALWCMQLRGEWIHVGQSTRAKEVLVEGSVL